MNLLKNVKISNLEFSKPVISAVWQNVLFNYNDNFFSMIHNGVELITNFSYITIKYHDHLIYYNYNEFFYHNSDGKIIKIDTKQDYTNGLFNIIYMEDFAYLIFYNNVQLIIIHINKNINFNNFNIIINNKKIIKILNKDLILTNNYKLYADDKLRPCFSTDNGYDLFIYKNKLGLTYNPKIIKIFSGAFVFGYDKLKIYLNKYKTQLLTYQLNQNNRFELSKMVYFIKDLNIVTDLIFTEIKSITFDRDPNVFLSNIHSFNELHKKIKLLPV